MSTWADYQKKIERKMQQELSASDCGGVIYAYTDGDGTIKVGRTNDLERRMREWDTKCPNPMRRWLGYVETAYSHQLGKWSLACSTLIVFRGAFTCQTATGRSA